MSCKSKMNPITPYTKDSFYPLCDFASQVIAEVVVISFMFLQHFVCFPMVNTNIPS